MPISLNALLESDCKDYKPFNFRDFCALDDSEDVGYLITSMDKMFSLDAIRAIKRRAVSLLNLQAGDSVLELGCGLGHDAEAIGEVVGSHGKVVAIDASMAMLVEAKRRSVQPHVEYQQGNGDKINYPDNFFSASYADRLLVSQKEPGKVLGELVRVVKPGGSVCVTDIDVGSAIIYPDNGKLNDLLLNRLAAVIEHPYIGRELHVLCKKSGLTDIKVFPETYLIRSFEQVNTMIDFPRMIFDLYKMDCISKDEAQQLSDSFCEAEKEGDFIYSITMFTVSGTKKL